MFSKCIYFKLNATVRELNRIWDSEFKSLDLTAPQGYMLKLILTNPGLPQKQIASELSLDRSTVTRLLEGLEKKALIKREGGTEDCRTIQVFPTTKAKKLESRLSDSTQRLIKKLSHLAPKEDIESMLLQTTQFLELLKQE